jgi:hypothetical protein
MMRASPLLSPAALAVVVFSTVGMTHRYHATLDTEPTDHRTIVGFDIGPVMPTALMTDQSAGVGPLV